MPHNTPQDVHVNRALTNFSLAYRQPLENYVAFQFAPVVPVAKQSDLYFTFNKGDLLRNVAEVRAPGSESAGSDVKITTAGPYFCKVVAIHHDLDMDLVANADDPLNPKRAATRNVTQWLLTRAELDFATAMFKASVWGTDWTGTSGTTAYASSVFKYWSDADADPVADVEAAKSAVQAQTGFEANTMVIPRDVFSTLRNHPKLLDRIKYTQRAAINELGGSARKKTDADILADLFDIDRVIVGRAVYNTAKENATDSISRILSNGCLIAYVNPAPTIEMPSAAYTFVWNDLFGVAMNEEGLTTPAGMGMRMLDYPLVWKKAHRVEGEAPYDIKPISTDCAIFLDKVLTA